ncbi:Shedu anti-phage system protein SduA domain-containing protein [Lentzea sp. NPDC051838]|uniref:Shedu anti-phage system protein SduA domain-containing protein n=1 Tax=Lentzea sp. NPDC051838 TaxID=3154849 RepID=UPI0034286012
MVTSAPWSRAARAVARPIPEEPPRIATRCPSSVDFMSPACACGGRVVQDLSCRLSYPSGMDLDLRKLRYFVAVAEQLSFGRAAEALHIAQPVLSRQIRALEAELKVQLFDRSSKGTELTPAGAQLLADARPLLASASALLRRVGVTDTFTVGFMPGLIVTAAVRVLSSRHPGLRVDVVRTTWEDQVEVIHDGRVDVGYVRLPVPAAGLSVVPLFTEPRVAVVPATHRLAGKESVLAADLSGERRVQHTDPPGFPVRRGEAGARGDTRRRCRVAVVDRGVLLARRPGARADRGHRAERGRSGVVRAQAHGFDSRIHRDREASVTLTDADIPLGPLAGSELTLWCTKSGQLWHGDSECVGLKQKAREIVQVQPRKGAIADLVSPGRVHCVPVGPMADHFTAGLALVEFDGQTDSYVLRLKEDVVDLTAFDVSSIRVLHPTVAKMPLARLWKQCRERRESFLDVLSEKLEERLPVMVAAAWLCTNKRSRQRTKQRKYARFNKVAVHEFRSLDRLTEWDVRDLVTRHVLPKFLKLVKEGEPPNSAASRVSAEQADWARQAVGERLPDLPDQVLAAWTRTTLRWIGLLDGICTAHHGDTFAVFHEHQMPLPTHAIHRLFPCSRIRSTTFSWLAGRIPAIFRLFLQERDRGLNGLELDSEHIYDDEQRALFLRNLFTVHGLPQLARRVETVATNPPKKPPVDTSDLNMHLRGFGYGVGDGGLSPAECRYALNAALHRRRLKKQWWVEPDDDPEPTSDVAGLPAEVVRLLEQGDGAELLSALQLHVRRGQLRAVQEVAKKHGSQERDLQTALTNAWWMFGGEFVGEAVRRRLVETIELDIPLLQPDGVLHVVELKRADAAAVRRHRNGLIVAGVVNEAVGQTMNYLTLLDEQRASLLNEFSIDTRRASATVVVGHPDFQEDLTPAEIHETLRIFNSHLSRVEVITYQQLLERAERVLDLIGKPELSEIAQQG